MDLPESTIWLKHLLSKYTSDKKAIGMVFFLIDDEVAQLDLMLFILDNPDVSMAKILEKAAKLSKKIPDSKIDEFMNKDYGK